MTRSTSDSSRLGFTPSGPARPSTFRIADTNAALNMGFLDLARDPCKICPKMNAAPLHGDGGIDQVAAGRDFASSYRAWPSPRAE